ncbi:hypothetical protein [Nannocystis pusilla]|uniref:Uncharacterized protein n=1 Tax=Nannocystis pusilla TaxID=889268 RepID=A0ABS7U065_9BACT|nr:hypothetical protein [Nannocystis pusilla]MBZ5713732.1 hypothetical protein [Nannocystis pusilla]
MKGRSPGAGPQGQVLGDRVKRTCLFKLVVLTCAPGRAPEAPATLADPEAVFIAGRGA